MTSFLSKLLGLDPNALAGARWSDLSIRWVGLPTAAEGSVTAWQIFGGHPHGLTFASQISKIETLRSEQTFGTLLRGLQVYGAQVLDGIALTELYAVRG